MPKKLLDTFHLKSCVFQNRPKAPILLGLLLYENLSPRALKITQYGHTADKPYVVYSSTAMWFSNTDWANLCRSHRCQVGRPHHPHIGIRDRRPVVRDRAGGQEVHGGRLQLHQSVYQEASSWSRERDPSDHDDSVRSLKGSNIEA